MEGLDKKLYLRSIDCQFANQSRGSRCPLRVWRTHSNPPKANKDQANIIRRIRSLPKPCQRPYESGLTGYIHEFPI